MIIFKFKMDIMYITFVSPYTYALFVHSCFILQYNSALCLTINLRLFTIHLTLLQRSLDNT